MRLWCTAALCTDSQSAGNERQKDILKFTLDNTDFGTYNRKARWVGKILFRGVAQLVARMVRDHEAASSSLATPTRKALALRKCFFNEINPFGICEIPLFGVKYGFAMWNACGREGIYFISRSAKEENFAMLKGIISHLPQGKYVTDLYLEQINCF